MSAPLAYLITFTTYGTWLHGDTRGSRHHRDLAYPTLPIDANARWAATERASMRDAPVTLDLEARALVQRVVADVCAHNRWTLLAVNARTQHVHVVVAGAAAPAETLRALKSWTSRRLRESGFATRNRRIWTRHGSTVFLWTRGACERAIHYVLFGQDRQTAKN